VVRNSFIAPCWYKNIPPAPITNATNTLIIAFIFGLPVVLAGRMTGLSADPGCIDC
jgi:hypothetical protein